MPPVTIKGKFLFGFLSIVSLMSLLEGLAIAEQRKQAERAASREATHVAETIAHTVLFASASPVHTPLYLWPKALQAYIETLHTVQHRDVGSSIVNK